MDRSVSLRARYSTEANTPKYKVPVNDGFRHGVVLGRPVRMHQ